MKAVISNRIYLGKYGNLYEELREKLKYSIPSKIPGKPPTTYCDVTRINKDVLTIPCGRTDLIPKDYTIVDKRTINNCEFPKFKYKLFDSQQEIYDSVNDSCVINANPSWGKTFMGIALATKLKQKTLIVVHTKYLKDQWVEEVKKCLGIDAGIIGDGKFEADKLICIALIQTLRNNITKVNKANFGLIIVDEVHHLPATVFKRIIDNLKSRFKIGLTATLWRKDGTHVYIPDYLGTKVYRAKDERRLKPNIVVVNSNIKLNQNSNIPWANRLTELYNDPKYLELVLNLCEAQVYRGHKVLMVNDRLEFLYTCAEILENFMCITGDTIDRAFDKDKKDGILATMRIFSEGVNIPPLSSLIMSTPINNRGLLDQLIGRILRQQENKITPEVIDIALSGKTGKNQLVQRINYYVDMGYKIRYIE